MRSLNMFMGMLLVAAGVLMIANEGITFLSVAFILGILLMVAGVAECLSFKAYRGNTEETTWILVDGFTTFALGFLIIMNKLAADATVPLVLGFWVLITGIRNLIRAAENIEARDSYFYGHAIIGAFGILAGLYMYFNNDLLAMTTGIQVGICLLVQGANAFMVASTIIVFKPDFLKTKEELLAQAVEDAQKAQEAAKEAIMAAREAEAMVKEVKHTPEELLDKALAPKPGEEIPTVVEPVAEESPIPEQKEKKEKPARKKVVEKKPAKEKPVEEKLAKEKPVEEKPVEEKPAKEKPVEAPKKERKTRVKKAADAEAPKAEAVVEKADTKVEVDKPKKAADTAKKSGRTKKTDEENK